VSHTLVALSGWTTESRLKVLKLRGNQLQGQPTQLLGCHSLTQLDISNNKFRLSSYDD